MLLSRFDESRVHCEEAIAIARSLGARREEGHALNTLGVDLACLGDPDTAVAHLKDARAIAEEVGDLDDLARAYLNLAEILAAPLDRIEEAIEVARDGIALCEEVGLDCDYGVSLRAIAAGALFELGRWDEAEAVVAEAAERSPIECAAIDLHLAGAKVAAGRGPLDAADRHLAGAGELMTNTRDPQYTGPFAARTAELALWRRRPREALAEALDGLGRVDDCWFGAPLLWLGIRAAADVGDAATGDRLAARASEVLTGRSPVLGAYERSCRAEATRLAQPDPEAFAAAAAAWDRARRPYPAAYCRFREAEALLEQRRRRAAAKALAAARAAADRLGAAPLLAELDLLAQRGRIDRVPAAEVAAEPGPAGLTSRELEVLALVARGLTNRDVGRALFVTEKTASAHVSSILSKLSVRSRVEAAAAAHRLGIVET